MSASSIYGKVERKREEALLNWKGIRALKWVNENQEKKEEGNGVQIAVFLITTTGQREYSKVKAGIFPCGCHWQKKID